MGKEEWETVKVKFYISTNKIGSEIEDVYDTGMSREQWGALTPEQQEDIMREVAFNYIEWGYEEV